MTSKRVYEIMLETREIKREKKRDSERYLVKKNDKKDAGKINNK